MKINAHKIRLQYSENREPEIVLTTRHNVQKEAEELKTIIAKGHELSVEIKQDRPNRSHNANAYMWALLSKMAEILKATKDELYLIMLDRYGVFTHVIVKPNVVEKVKQEWRTVRELGEVTVNGQSGIQLQCYFGSSAYDTKEMARLIDGVVSEAKELGIETLTPNELSRLKQEWSV